MTDSELKTLFEKYLHAFTATAPAEQERLLRSSLADDVSYTNPGVDGSSVSNLLKHVDGFQKRFPGGSFRLNWIRQQHGQVLAEWTQVQNGSDLVTGHTYGRLNAGGRLSHLAGFWHPGAV